VETQAEHIERLRRARMIQTLNGLLPNDLRLPVDTAPPQGVLPRSQAHDAEKGPALDMEIIAEATRKHVPPPAKRDPEAERQRNAFIVKRAVAQSGIDPELLKRPQISAADALLALNMLLGAQG
jgi:hypothetical protein